jgi:streptogramin lyase
LVRLFRYDAETKTWAHWHLPGDGPQPYAVYVDESDAVWVSDWGANAINDRVVPFYDEHAIRLSRVRENGPAAPELCRRCA